MNFEFISLSEENIKVKLSIYGKYLHADEFSDLFGIYWDNSKT
jgi:hypothetical protein